MSLNIVICIKTVALQAPDKTGRTPREAYALNPFDRPAMEAALELKAALGGGHITALSMGPTWAVAALCEGLALGFDRAVLLCDPALAGSDTLATATALAAALQRLQPWDLVLFGSRTADGDTGHVGPQTALGLDLPMVTGATRITPGEEGLQVVRRADGWLDTFQMALPGAVAVDPEAWTLRDTPLAGMGTGYRSGAVETWSLEDIGISSAEVGESGSPTRVLAIRPLVRDKTCTFIEGAPTEQADALVSRLQALGVLE